MPQYLELPNGSYLELKEGQTAQEGMAVARQLYPDAFGIKPQETVKPQKGGIAGALGLGAESLASSLRTAAGAVTDPEQAAKEALARQQALSEKYAEPTSMERVKKAYEEQGLLSAAKEVASQIPTAIAEQVPQLGTMAGGARLGAMAGTPFGPVGTVAGGVLGAGAALLPQFFGSNIERQAAEQAKAGQPIDINRGTALASAAGQAGLEAAGTAFTLGGRLVSKLTGIPEKALLVGEKNAQKLADERLRDVILKGTAKGFGVELPVELGQQMAERAQAGLSLTDSDALKEYGQTAYQVGLLSPLGAAGRISERAGARQQVAQAQQEETAKAALLAEAQKNTPEALNQLYENFTQLSQRRDELNAQVNELRPKKGATPEERAAYEQAKVERNTFMQQEYAPVAQEYNKRKDAIDTMMAAKQSALETATEQPTAARPLPSDIPGAQPFQLSDVTKLMHEHENLRTALRDAQEEYTKGADVARQRELEAQMEALGARQKEMVNAIHQKGGTHLTEQEFNNALASADKSRLAAMAEGNIELAKKHAATVEDLQARRPHLEELKQFRQQAGQTRELFGGVAPTKTAAQLEQERQTRAEEQERTAYMRGEKPAEEPKAAQVIQPKQLEAVETAKTQAATAQQDLATAAKSKDTDAIYAALNKANQAENAVSRAREDVGRPTLRPAIVDIFDPSNIIRTAIDNGDTKLLNDMAAHSDRTALQQALDKSTDERTKLTNVLEGRWIWLAKSVSVLTCSVKFTMSNNGPSLRMAHIWIVSCKTCTTKAAQLLLNTSG